MIKKNNLKNMGGGLLGITSGICWGLDTVLIGIALTMFPFNNVELVFLAPFISSFFHDGFSAIWILILTFIKGDFGKLKKAFKSKDCKIISIGAILGGPIGMSGYLLAVKYMGAAYAASISAIYPVVGALISRVFFKEKLSKKSYVGLIISITALFILGYTNQNEGNPNFWLGFIFILIGVFGWALEGVICSRGMKSEDISPYTALQIRQIVSALTYIIIVIPLFGGFKYIKTTLFSYAGMQIIIIALIGTVSYICYYKAIDKIGSTKAMCMNITYCIWAIVFGAIFGTDKITIKLLVCGTMVLIGTILGADNNE